MKIGIFSEGMNIPPKEGIVVHAYDQLFNLSKRNDCEVVLIACDRGWTPLEAYKTLPVDTILMPEADFYDRSTIASLIQREQLDITQCYMTYYGAAVLGPASYDARVPFVMEHHDIEQRVVPLYLTGENDDISVEELDQLQKEAAKLSSGSRVMSKYDYYDELQNIWPDDFDEQTFFWLPVSKEQNEKVEHIEQNATVLYLGNMSYAPNAEGARIIVDTIAPEDNSLHYLFVGRGSQDFSGPNIRSVGMVENIEPYIQKSAIGIAPIISGSGMKIKNLTYLQYGLPVLTTTLGAQGFPESEALIVENDFKKWPIIINKIVQDKAELRRLSSIAYDYFSAYFESNMVNNLLVQKYAQIIDSYDIRSIATPKQYAIDMKFVYWLREAREKSTPRIEKITRIEGTS